jgi:hypothetical protein
MAASELHFRHDKRAEKRLDVIPKHYICTMGASCNSVRVQHLRDGRVKKRGATFSAKHALATLQGRGFTACGCWACPVAPAGKQQSCKDLHDPNTCNKRLYDVGQQFNAAVAAGFITVVPRADTVSSFLQFIMCPNVLIT